MKGILPFVDGKYTKGPSFPSKMARRAFSLTWPASVQICGNKRNCLHKNRVQLSQDLFGTPTWPPFNFIVSEHQYGHRDVI